MEQRYCCKQTRSIPVPTVRPGPSKPGRPRSREEAGTHHPEHVTCISRAPVGLPGHYQCRPFSGPPCKGCHPPPQNFGVPAGRPPPVPSGCPGPPLTSLAAAAAEGPGAGAVPRACPGGARSRSSSGRPRASGPGASARPQRPCARPSLALGAAAAAVEAGREGRRARAPDAFSLLRPARRVG